jgi:hypothetical protein
MAGNALRVLTALGHAGGVRTAYTAPSGTAIAIHTLAISTNYLSGTAGMFTAAVWFGPTANPQVLLHPTGITANSRIVLSGVYPLGLSGWGVVVSASSASAVDVYMAGLVMT